MDHTRRLHVELVEFKYAGPRGGEMAVSVGKYIRGNVYVEVAKGLGVRKDDLSVEVELSPPVTLETDAGTDADAGVGINWQWDY